MVGVTYTMLERLDRVIGAFQRDDGLFEVFSLASGVYRANMKSTRSKGTSSGRVGVVKKGVFIKEGLLVSTVTIV